MLLQSFIPFLAALPFTAGQLNSLAAAAGKLYFGSATDNPTLNEGTYVDIIRNRANFGSITVGNGQKWQFTEPQRNQFSYNSGDQIVNFAKGNGQIVRCHTLVWHSQLPDWVSQGRWSKGELTSIIENHIANVVGHYRGKCYAWDVVNEALEDDGSFRKSVFYNVLGQDFLSIAFKAAARADPVAKLYYNDYNIEYPGAKADATIRIVKALKAAGAKIDGVGSQAHLIVGNTPSRSTLASVLRSFVNAGVTEVAFTELDIRHSSLPASAQGREQQAKDYVSVVGACLDVKACVGVTIWDFTDKHSWIPSVFPGQGEALPWDANYRPKPAYTSMSSLLAAAATAAPRAV